MENVEDSCDPSAIQKPNQSTNNVVILRPNPDKCFARVPTLTSELISYIIQELGDMAPPSRGVDGVDDVELEVLNDWYNRNWNVVHYSNFTMNDAVITSFTSYMEGHASSSVDLDRLESYLSVQKLLYIGLRILYLNTSISNISQDKQFQEYFYTLRENPTALNSLIVLSNVLWLMKRCMDDVFALTCLVDVMLQAYLAALESFVNLDGVAIIKESIDYLAMNKKLSESTGYLMKCITLLDKLDISFKILQTSKIGITINGIASSGQNSKLNINYECGSNQVKLKATNLIKKWKAIRDASLPPGKTPPARDAHLKRKASKIASGSSNTTGSTNPSIPTTPNSGGKEGSFVLDIINTMVEQREIEKKRKQEIRNSQINSKFKLARAQSSDKTCDVKSTSVSGQDSSLPPISREASDESSKGQTTYSPDPPSTEEPTEKPSELASLVNFFKEYTANNPENKKTGTPPITTVPPSPEMAKRRSRFSDAPTPHENGKSPGCDSGPNTSIHTNYESTDNSYVNFYRRATESPEGDELNSSYIPPWK